MKRLSIIACAVLAGAVLTSTAFAQSVTLTIRGSFNNPEGGYMCAGSDTCTLWNSTLTKGFGSSTVQVDSSDKGYKFNALVDGDYQNITLDGTCAALGGQIIPVDGGKYPDGTYPSLQVVIPPQMIKNNSFSLNFKFIKYGSGWRFQCQPT